MSSLQVTASIGGASSDGLILAVVPLAGALPRASQTAPPGFAGEAATHPPDPPITPTTTGSWVFGATEYAPNTAITAQTSPPTTIDLSFTNTIIGAAAFHAGPVTSGVQIFPGGTAPVCSAGEIVLAEILPATTISQAASAQTASTASGTSAQTPAFSPAAGTLLVAAAAGYSGGVGVDTINISDTLGLTWSQLVIRNVAGQGCAVIWVADAPAAPPSTGLNRAQDLTGYVIDPTTGTLAQGALHTGA